MKKEYIIPSVYVVEVKGCQLLHSHSITADPETTTDEQCVRRFVDDEEEDNGSLLLGDPNN